jgi:transcriptional regulator
MYIPKHFNEPNIKVMHDFIRVNSLSTIVITTDHGLNANHIPLILVENDSFGILQGHFARANPIWQESLSDVESIAIFHGSNAYISPSFYATKEENGKVVPTWNYAVVHAYGKLRMIDDAVWLRSQIEYLTAQQESGFPESWKLTDAPNDYIEKLITAVVGIEIVITKLEGKWKVSQNQPEQNKESVAVGLKNRNNASDAEMIELVIGKKI